MTDGLMIGDQLYELIEMFGEEVVVPPFNLELKSIVCIDCKYR